MKKLVIGYGEDIHRLAKGRRLVLGGIEIPYEMGLEGHSDADAVLHALGDALLGASAKGDIGLYFPDRDEATRNMDSSLIVKRCLEVSGIKSADIHNVDISISAEAPRLSPYVVAMREKIASVLGVSPSRVSIKAMTNEGLDAVGEKKAIRAVAVLLGEVSE